MASSAGRHTAQLPCWERPWWGCVPLSGTAAFCCSAIYFPLIQTLGIQSSPPMNTQGPALRGQVLERKGTQLLPTRAVYKEEVRASTYGPWLQWACGVSLGNVPAFGQCQQSPSLTSARCARTPSCPQQAGAAVLTRHAEQSRDAACLRAAESKDMRS